MKSILYTLLLKGFCSFLSIGQIPTPDPCIDGAQQTCRCASAPVLCTIDDLDGYEFAMSDFQHPEDGPDLFCGDPNASADNPTWFSFVAWCEALELEVEIENCNEVCLTGGPCTFLCNLLGNCSSGVQIAIFGDCDYNEVVACSVGDCGNENTKQLVMNDLIVGETYHFVIDGCGGSSCDRVRVNVVGSCGSQQIEDWSNPIAGPSVFCKEDTVLFQVDSLDGAESYFWFLNGVLFDSTTTSSYPLMLQDTGTYELCVDVQNLPCVPRFNDPEQICTTIKVVELQLNEVILQPASACPNDQVSIRLGQFDEVPELFEAILITNTSGIVQEVNLQDSAVFTHSSCDTFIVYAYQSLDTIIDLPIVGDTLEPGICITDCCRILSERLVFEDTIAPFFTNPPEDASFPCLSAIPDIPVLGYEDNCDSGGVVLGEERGLPFGVDTGSLFRSWTVSDACQNNNTFEQRIRIPNSEPFEIELTPSFAEAVTGELVRVEATSGLNEEAIARIEWMPPFDLSCADCLITEITANEDQRYTLTLTDTLGCMAEATFELLVRVPDVEIYIPNTFTPNGDGINDAFTLFSSSDLQEVELMIFDRWGSRIFYSNAVVAGDEASGWDGTIKGRPADPGVYVYSFRLQYADGSFETIKGDVLIAP
jgi:gliding motility-associated-like protein